MKRRLDERSRMKRRPCDRDLNVLNIVRLFTTTSKERVLIGNCGASVLRINNTHPIFCHNSEFRIRNPH